MEKLGAVLTPNFCKDMVDGIFWEGENLSNTDDNGIYNDKGSNKWKEEGMENLKR